MTGEGVIQLVSKAANHLSHGGQPFALNELMLEFLFHRNVTS